MGRPKDIRDERTWVVLELSPAGEAFAKKDELLPLVERLFEDREIFIPYVTMTYNGKTALFNVFEGYIFVESGLDDSRYRSAATDSPFLKKVLGGAGFVPHTVSDGVIQGFRQKLAEMMAVEVQEGMNVEVSKGVCCGLRGRVVHVEDSVAHVLISMRTLHTIRIIPCYALTPTEVEDV